MVENVLRRESWPSPKHDGAERSEGRASNELRAEALGEEIALAVVAAIRQESQSGSEALVRIKNFRSPRLRLREELLVHFEREGPVFVAWSHDTGQYGSGFCVDDAIQNLCEIIEDYYDLLEEESGALAPRLASHRRFLHDVLEPRR